MSVDLDALVEEVYGPGLVKTREGRWPRSRPKQPAKPKPRTIPEELPWRDRLAQFRKDILSAE